MAYDALSAVVRRLDELSQQHASSLEEQMRQAAATLGQASARVKEMLAEVGKSSLSFQLSLLSDSIDIGQS